MTNTPNARLARVLRLLADVVSSGPGGYSDDTEDALGSCFYAFRPPSDMNEFWVDEAERHATEAARLAGVPLDGWYASEPPRGVELLVWLSQTHFIPGFALMTWDGKAWFVDHYRAHDSAVIAWRPLPEPYRPEEKTDEQR